MIRSGRVAPAPQRRAARHAPRPARSAGSGGGPRWDGGADAGRELQPPSLSIFEKLNNVALVGFTLPPFTARAFFADKSLAVERFGLALRLPLLLRLLASLSSPLLGMPQVPWQIACRTDRQRTEPPTSGSLPRSAPTYHPGRAPEGPPIGISVASAKYPEGGQRHALRLS